jgi:glycosyltransferase involved in cell wall biosynthesis
VPEFSVVIPSYNHAAYIGEAVESVLNQTRPDLELIVVDDGSTDSSLEVLSRFSDPRLRVIAQANQGAHAALNRGLEAAAGEYIAILNSDDAYHPQRLEKAAIALAADPQPGLVGSYIEIVDSRGKPQGVKHGYADCPPWLLERPERSFRAGADLQDALLTENYWSTTSNFVFPRRVFHQVGGFLPLRFTHDWDFALRVSRVAPMVLLPEPLMRYRVHARNTIRQDQAAMIFEICWIQAVHVPPHVAKGEFYGSHAPQERIDQLLHSLYAFGVDRVLSVMLLQNLSANPKLALELLAPDNPTRARYIEFISRQLEVGAKPGFFHAEGKLRHFLKNLKPKA